VFVDLAPLRKAPLVTAIIAQALGLPEGGRPSGREQPIGRYASGTSWSYSQARTGFVTCDGAASKKRLGESDNDWSAVVLTVGRGEHAGTAYCCYPRGYRLGDQLKQSFSDGSATDADRVGERLPIVANAMREKKFGVISPVRDDRSVIAEVGPELPGDVLIKNDGQVLEVPFAMPFRLQV
jgi:hypothetical protein